MKLSPYSLLIVLLIFFASCSKKSNVPVPVDAGFVMHINGSSLLSKVSWDEFKQGELYKTASEEIHDEFQSKILSNPDSTGIDLKGDAYIFTRSMSRGGYIALTCAIKDEKQFSEFMARATEDKIVKEAGLSVIKDRDNVFTWNNERMVLISNSPNINSNPFTKMGSSANSRYPEDSLVKFASEIYTLKGSNSVGSNKKFTAMMKEPGDMHFWINSGKAYGSSLPAMLSITKLSVLMDGNYTTATLNFDNGKIDINSKTYYNKELTELYKKYGSKNIDESMFNKIPSGNVTGVLAINYPPEGLKAFLTLLGLDGLINMYLSEIGYSIDEFVKATKGDLMFAVTDLVTKEQEVRYGTGPMDVYKTQKPDAKMLFAASVNDETAFQKLITIVTEKINEGGPRVTAMAEKIPYQLKNGWFVAGDSVSVHSFGTGNTSHSFASKFSGHSIGMFVDVQKIITGLNGFYTDSTSRLIADRSAKFWQDVMIYGDIKNEEGIAHMEINLVDKNTNSLKQLNDYLGAIAKEVKAKEDKAKTDMESLVPPPVIDSTKIVPKTK